MADKFTIRRRNRHAIWELRDRGVLRNGKLAPGLRLAMWMFPNLRAPYYGSNGAYGVILGVGFGLPMGLFVGFILMLDGQYSPWWAVVAGALSGLAFGAIFSGYMASVHRRMKLTPWEDLDNPVSGEAPEGAEDLEDLADELARRMLR